MRKIQVGILFGGRSAEHDISLQSAQNVVKAIDKEKYEAILIGVDRNGLWYLNDLSKFMLNAQNPEAFKLNDAKRSVMLTIGKTSEQLMYKTHPDVGTTLDVIFPVLHGTYGEDGTMQGFLELANLPYVGAGVLGSAVGMDKDVMKRLLRDAKIPIANFLVFRYPQKESIEFRDVVAELGLPLFIKPANLGSSVGISFVDNQSKFDEAINLAFQYDTKILIEEYIEGREIECSVLGNEEPIASLPGEIITHNDFYSYEAKYLDENKSTLEVPAKLNPNLTQKIQEMAVRIFQTLCCEGMARVDFFLRNEHEILVNEINTIPGFTAISMYPKLWEASGMSVTDLIDRLIQLALERGKRKQMLKTSL